MFWRQPGDNGGLIMSDENQGTASSPDATVIPKVRFDEINQKYKQAEAEAQALRGILANQRPQARAPQQESAYMKSLKETDPARYQHEKAAELRSMQASAASYAAIDQADRTDFILQTGKLGQKSLEQVESIIQQERQRGNFNVNRLTVFRMIKGQEALEKELAEVNTPKPKIQTQSTTTEDIDAPSQDPSAVGTIPKGAAKGSTEPTLEELEARLLNQEF